MKISDSYSYMSQISSSRAAVPAPAREVVKKASTSQSDSVGGVAAGAAQARQGRVDELRQRVQSGTYQPDSRQVSQSIVGQHLNKL